MGDKPSLKEAWLCHVSHLNFSRQNRISGTAAARVVRFWTQARSRLSIWMTNHF